MTSWASVTAMVEAQLYAYYERRPQRPTAPISSAYEGMPPCPPEASQPERYVLAHGDVTERAAIERVLRVLPGEDRTLVELRYRDRCAWGYIARRIGCRRQDVYVRRARVLALLAYELGILSQRAARAMTSAS